MDTKEQQPDEAAAPRKGADEPTIADQLAQLKARARTDVKEARGKLERDRAMLRQGEATLAAVVKVAVEAGVDPAEVAELAGTDVRKVREAAGLVKRRKPRVGGTRGPAASS